VSKGHEKCKKPYSGEKNVCIYANAILEEKQ
jgi:hypothetical protein